MCLPARPTHALCAGDGVWNVNGERAVRSDEAVGEYGGEEEEEDRQRTDGQAGQRSARAAGKVD